MNFKPGEVDQIIGRILAQNVVLKYLLHCTPIAHAALHRDRDVIENGLLAVAMTDAQLAETMRQLDALIAPLLPPGSAG